MSSLVLPIVPEPDRQVLIIQIHALLQVLDVWSSYAESILASIAPGAPQCRPGFVRLTDADSQALHALRCRLETVLIKRLGDGYQLRERYQPPAEVAKT